MSTSPSAPVPAPTPTQRPRRAPRVLGAGLACALSIVALALLTRGAVGTARGQRLDQLILTAGQSDTSPVARVVFPVLNTVTVPVIVGMLVVAGVLALLRRRYGVIVQIAVLVAGAAATSQVLKHLVVQRSVLASGLAVTPNSFPSGHTTMAATVGVALVWAAPRRGRGIVAVLAAAWMALAGLGTIAGGWHRPSDVLGGLLVVAAWTFGTLAVTTALGAPRSHSRRAMTRQPAAPRGRSALGLIDLLAGLALALGAVAGLALGGIRLASIPVPLRLTDPISQSLGYTATIGVVGGCACALTAALLVLLAPDPVVPIPAEHAGDGVYGDAP